MKDLKQSIYNVLFDDSGKYYLYNTDSVNSFAQILKSPCSG